MAWRLAAAETDGAIFPDAAEGDALMYTETGAQRILVGASNAAGSALAVSSSNVRVAGTLEAAGLTVNGMQLTTGSGTLRADALDDGSLPPGKLEDAVPVSLGGTGRSEVAHGSVLIGNGSNAFLASSNLSFDVQSDLLHTISVSACNLAVGTVPDVEARLLDLGSGSAMTDGAVESRHLASGAVGTAAIGLAAVTEDRLASTLSVLAGGTGRSNLDAGSLLVGNGAGGVLSPSNLLYSVTDERLQTVSISASNLAVGAVPDVEARLLDLGSGSAMTDGAVESRHLASGAVGTAAIGLAAVTEDRLASTLSVPAGGTGRSNLGAGSLLVGNAVGGVLSPSNLVFSVADERLQTVSISASNLAVGAVPDVEARLLDLGSGSGLTDGAVESRHLASGAVGTAAIGLAAVTEDRLASTLSVPAGGTGRPNLDAGSLLVGNGAGGVLSPSNLLYSVADERLETVSISASNLAVGAVPDVEARLLDLGSGSGLTDGAVESRHLAAQAVGTAALALGCVTEDRLASTLSVPAGGTGRPNLDAGSLLVGNGTGGVLSPSNLLYSVAEERLETVSISASNLAVGAVPDVEARLLDLSTGTGLADDAVLSRHIAAQAVGTAALALGCVTEDRLASTLGVPAGGTGRPTLDAGSLLVGNGTGGVLSPSNLAYDGVDDVLTTLNFTASNRAHVHSDLVLGAPGEVRYRFLIDNSNNLAINFIGEDNVESPYVNFADVVTLLSNVSIVP